MAQPQKYERSHDFEADDDLNKSALNLELDNVSISINGIRANLALIQNDDGSLKAGTVTIESLAPDVLDHLSTEITNAVELSAQYADSASNSARTAIEARDDTLELNQNTKSLHDAVEKNAQATKANADLAVEKANEVLANTRHVDEQKNAVDALTKRAETAATSAEKNKAAVDIAKASVDASEKNVTDLEKRALASQQAALQSEKNAKASETKTAEYAEAALVIAPHVDALNAVADGIDEVKDVASIKEDVVATSEVSGDIVVVASDLRGSLCEDTAIESDGSIEEELDQEFCVEGGNIKIVADHIESVDKAAEAVENGNFQTIVNSIETTTENVRQAKQAQLNTESANTSAQEAKNAARSSETLSKKWATQTDAPVEGELYGAKYYADKASASANAAKVSETNAKASETNAKASATEAQEAASKSKDWSEKLDGPVSGNQYSARFWVQRAEQESRNATVKAKEAATSATEAGTKASEAATSAQAAQDSAKAAKESANIAGFSMRLTTVNMSASGTAALSSLLPQVNIKVGDTVVDPDGEVFSITAVGESTFTVGNRITSIKGVKGDTGTTDFNQLQNKPVLGTLASKDKIDPDDLPDVMSDGSIE